MPAQQIQKIFYKMEVYCTRVTWMQGIHDFYLAQSFDSHVFLRAMLYILMLEGKKVQRLQESGFCLDKQLFPLHEEADFLVKQWRNISSILYSIVCWQDTGGRQGYS